MDFVSWVALCFLAIFLAIVLFLVGLRLYYHFHPEKALEMLEQKYSGALEELRKDPSNQTKYETALTAGQLLVAVLSQAEREMQNQYRFDELCSELNLLLQDTREAQSKAPLEERLQTLGDLYNKGLINQHEYQQRREKILDSI